MTTLMADLVTQQQMGEGPGQHITQKAKQLLAQLLLPKQITGKLIEKYIRKAMRTGAWRKLPPQTKALLYTAKRFPRFKSKIITQLLHQILINIELTTTKGKALHYGILITIKQTLYSIKQILTINKNILSKILFLGINYLNKPSIYRIYG